MSKKTIAVDFDGTLFTEDYPNIGKPKWGVINWCKKQKELGNILILWTCREGELLSKAVQACRNVGLEFDYINENAAHRLAMYGNDCRKIGADIYLDDRAMNIKELYDENRNK